MKIKIIEPVIETSHTKQTNFDLDYIRSNLGAEVTFDIEYLEEGYESIETLAEQKLSIPGILRIVHRINQEKCYDGIFINCFNDPGVFAAKAISKIPVFGAFLPSIKLATTIGKNIAILSTSSRNNGALDSIIDFYNVKCHLQEISYLNTGVLNLYEKEETLPKLYQKCLALSQNKIDTIILGCTVMSFLIIELSELVDEKRLNIRIIEPKSVGLKWLKMCIELGLNNSNSGNDFFKFPYSK